MTRFRILLPFSALTLCLILPTLLEAQAFDSQPASAPISTGSLAGVVRDPSGLVVTGATIEVRNPATGFERTTVTDPQGRFLVRALPAGRYQVAIAASSFNSTLLPLTIRAGHRTATRVALQIARVRTEVEVDSQDFDGVAVTRHTVDQEDREQSHNAAEMLQTMPGTSLRTNGELGSVPILHGLGDERTKLVVDGDRKSVV